ncbi:hypothetical protein Rhal01_03345 [Rubritalea halochordaticola]|uniref:PDZ domain-containing protein n=2 Tax=Rubritalea halochordaticola TaxID=714537 RepID=A0ABP9V544_9BACT
MPLRGVIVLNMRKLFPLKPLLVLTILTSAFGIQGALAERPYFNDKKVPDSREDLLAIQDALTSSLEKARAATVCIQIGKGSGSGVIISEDGLILTAAHVTGATNKKLKVIMEDGTELEAVSMGLNSENDAAMMKITTEGKYPFVEIDSAKSFDESDLKLGDWVFSLGHSGGFDKERGSVVRLGRLVRIANHTIQSDCILIGGDSGGPLFDMNGKLIGIHSRVGKVLDQNMHVPMHVYHTFWKQLSEGEFIGDGPFAQRPVPGSGFIGIAVKEVEGGLEITELDEKAPAKAAEVKVGDILVKVNDDVVQKRDQMAKLMKQYAAGDELELTLLREGKEITVKVVLDKR